MIEGFTGQSDDHAKEYIRGASLLGIYTVITFPKRSSSMLAKPSLSVYAHVS